MRAVEYAQESDLFRLLQGVHILAVLLPHLGLFRELKILKNGGNNKVEQNICQKSETKKTLNGKINEVCVTHMWSSQRS